MDISIFNLFNLGIGPSSSHTMGPMRAAHRFINELQEHQFIKKTARLHLEVFGSLAHTGEGHGTRKAILMGLEGEQPESIEPNDIPGRVKQITDSKTIKLGPWKTITFNIESDLIFDKEHLLPHHTNGMHFQALDENNSRLYSNKYYSIGGGFIIDASEAQEAAHNKHNIAAHSSLPYYFGTAAELTQHCEKNNLSISELMLANERHWQSEKAIREKLLRIADVMQESIKRGCNTSGILPGGLQVKRRAYDLHKKLLKQGQPSSHESTHSLDWLNMFAIAVNEENAAGGRVVTAPTNGSAGVIPALLQYYKTFYPNAKESDTINFLLTAGAIGLLYKKGASISGAEVGCQGEIGVSSSMGAGAFAALLGGSLPQILNAAEIAMEHHLGMTCDPVAGLVQIPCIERNAMGAVKALNAARLALLGDGTQKVSLDKVIATMLQTGRDMKTIYKETSLGGLAANVPEC